MNSKQRLADLEDVLDIEYKKLSEFQYRIAHTASVAEKFDLEVRIKKEVMPNIRKYEEEYFSILAEEVRTCEVAEVDASYAIVEVVPKIERIVNKSSTKYPDELMQKLQEILDKLNEPQTPAAAKLKAAVPLIPLIMSYEVELDTEILLTRVFDGIRQLFKKSIEAEKKK